MAGDNRHNPAGRGNQQQANGNHTNARDDEEHYLPPPRRNNNNSRPRRGGKAAATPRGPRNGLNANGHRRALPPRRSDYVRPQHTVANNSYPRPRKRKRTRSPTPSDDEEEYTDEDEDSDEDVNDQEEGQGQPNVAPPNLAQADLMQISAVASKPSEANVGGAKAPIENGVTTEANLQQAVNQKATEDLGRFPDPIREADKAAKRLAWDADKTDGLEEPKGDNRGPETPGEQQLLRIIRKLGKLKLTPRDIRGILAQKPGDRKLEILLRNGGFLNAIIVGWKYGNLFGHLPYEFEMKWRITAPGKIFRATFVEPLRDPNIGIDNPDRTDTPNGPMITKFWFGLGVDRENKNEGKKDVKVVKGTAFSGKGRPPKSRWREYVQLVHVDDGIDPDDTSGIPRIRFTGKRNALWKPTFLRISRAEWIPIEGIPISPEGQLYHKDFEYTANLLGLDREHQFREHGRELAEQDRSEKDRDRRRQEEADRSRYEVERFRAGRQGQASGGAGASYARQTIGERNRDSRRGLSNGDHFSSIR